MQKRRVLLICSKHLFGESIERVLCGAQDLELVGPWDLDQDICSRIAEARPNVVIVADEDPQNDAVTYLTTRIIEQYPNLSVIRAGLTENVVRVFCTHLFPARGIDLLEMIRSMPAWDEAESQETRSSRPDGAA